MRAPTRPCKLMHRRPSEDRRVEPTGRRRANSSSDKALRRSELIEAAKAVFAQDGFHGAAIGDVARAAGVSHGTVYVYFASKEDLFRTLVESEGRALNDAVLEGIAASGARDPDAALVATVRSVLEHFARDPAAARVLLRDPASSEFAGQFLDQLSEIVADAQAHERIRSGPPKVIAFSFAALIGQFVQRRLRESDGMSDLVAAEFIVGVLMDGVRAPTTRKGPSY